MSPIPERVLRAAAPLKKSVIPPLKKSVAPPLKKSVAPSRIVPARASAKESAWLEELSPKIPVVAEGPSAEELWVAELSPRRRPVLSWMDELTPAAATPVTRPVVLQTENLMAQMSPTPSYRASTIPRPAQRIVAPPQIPLAETHAPPIHKAYQEEELEVEAVVQPADLASMAAVAELSEDEAPPKEEMPSSKGFCEFIL